jgi:uncharacterized protein with WD repeat
MTHQSISTGIAYLMLVTPSGNTTGTNDSKYPLSSTEEVVIGREETCQIVLASDQYPTVSRHHAKIHPFMDNSQIFWRVCDLGAANGTYLNGNRLQTCYVLCSGDRIMLGRDGPEFLFECEAIPASLPTIPRQEVPSESSLPQEDITLLPTQTSQFLTAPAAPSTQPIVVTPTKGEKTSSRSLWDLASEDKIKVLSGHDDLVRAVSFSPDEKYLASGSADKTIKIWNLELEEETQTLSGHKLAVNAVAFSPDGLLLASGSADRTIKIWNTKTFEEVQQFTGHGRGVSAIGFSPDSKLLATGSEDKTIKLWNLSAAEVVQTLAGYKMGVTAIAFSPDGALLASGSADGTAKVWKIASGEEFAVLPAFRGVVNSLVFSPDGLLLIISTTDKDKTIRIWNLKTEQEVRTGINLSRDRLTVPGIGML